MPLSQESAPAPVAGPPDHEALFPAPRLFFCVFVLIALILRSLTLLLIGPRGTFVVRASRSSDLQSFPHSCRLAFLAGCRDFDFSFLCF